MISAGCVEEKGMTADTQEAKRALESNGYTCVLRKGESVYFSFEHGIKPLMGWIREEKDFSGFGAADQVVGKAAAFLYVRLGVSELYGQIISEPTLSVLENHGISCFYDKKVPYIINRKKDGMCPMEQAVLEISDTEEAVDVLAARTRL